MTRRPVAAAGPAAATVNPALAAAVAAFHARTPPRIWSLIVSFIGDSMLPRSIGSGDAREEVQAGVIGDFCALAGVEPGLVRTALSRLVAKGILARQREGRKSFYRLTPEEHLAFKAAADLIYGRALPESDGRWDSLLIDSAADRAGARAAALAAGFVAYGPVTFLRPHHKARPVYNAAGIVVLTGEASGLDAATLWPLADLAASYCRFIQRYTPFAGETALPPAEAALARVLLVHDFRRVILRDPFLPAHALPGDWPAADARGLFDAAHTSLSPAAGQWLEAALGGG